MVSMPIDCVKTRLELGAQRPPTGLLRGSAACLRTGRTILAEKGVGGLFVGITPRLMENVPSTMFYWCVLLLPAIGGCTSSIGLLHHSRA